MCCRPIRLNTRLTNRWAASSACNRACTPSPRAPRRLAPFRGSLHERRARGDIGKDWLFCGEQHAASDFYYRDELTAMQHDGLLTNLSLAFSRDQTQKIYVQDRDRKSTRL